MGRLNVTFKESDQALGGTVIRMEVFDWEVFQAGTIKEHLEPGRWDS
jgi:hypothetical protein